MSTSIPKVLLFDVGGVCVVSPFQAILDYEVAKGIPPGYINFCISRSAPNGPWHKIERGEIPMDKTFFDSFKQDLTQPSIWEEYNVKASARANPTGSVSDASVIPPVPDIDAEWLFWEMMTRSRAPDPWMYPALKKLKESRKFIVAALSNTVIFPADHPFSQAGKDDVRNMFDLFISSAHVGMRKPDPRIYEYAIEKLKDLARQRCMTDELKPSDIVFLDDIGQNLKWARRAGMGTIRVILGKTDDAVRELEQITKIALLKNEAEGPRARL